jgi:type I restriction-modification system DNA methylase subunit
MEKKSLNKNLRKAHTAKKENGVVFTPEWVVDFMTEEIFNSQKIRGDEKILDAGCGEGVFAAIAAQKFSKISGKKNRRRYRTKYSFY